MSVATKNPFAILDAENASDFSSPAPAPKETAAPPAPARGAQRSRGGPAARGGKYYSRGGGNKSTPRDQNQSGAEEPPAEHQRKFEGGRGRGRGRGNQGGGRGRGRQFDRHSATGKTDSDKKIHQSWGGDDGKTELKVEQAATVDAAAEGSGDWGAGENTAADWGTPAADAPAAEGDKLERERPPRKEREPEEEDNTLTFDQYLAKQKEKESAVPKIESIRKANEGAGADIWKDVVPLQKTEEEEAYYVGKGKAAPKARNKKEEKVFLEIDARFERPDRGRGRGRGGDRGRGRGRGGRGGARQNGPALNVDDETAFPSLS
ncbi:hypothetical protein AX16_009598 [Volvariella volvacea WC 439]|nr:hypothetical protein AX16_009598 [Volvariella volvacea WC 439]